MQNQHAQQSNAVINQDNVGFVYNSATRTLECLGQVFENVAFYEMDRYRELAIMNHGKQFKRAPVAPQLDRIKAKANAATAAKPSHNTAPKPDKTQRKPSANNMKTPKRQGANPPKRKSVNSSKPKSANRGKAA